MSHVWHGKPTIDVHILHSFTDHNEGGNPAAVVLEAESLSLIAKQALAQNIGLSETAYVSASQCADFKLEFFTPKKQIAHCGHATVAAFALMAQRGLLSRGNYLKETIDGTRTVLRHGDAIFLEQRAPRISDLQVVSRDQILESLGLSAESLDPSCSLLTVDTGVPFILIPVRSRKDLSIIAPQFDLIESLSAYEKAIGYYVFTRETTKAGRHASARMFAPAYGINEESATGMAAGCLASYLHDQMKQQQSEFLIEQGHYMTPPSPSLLTARLDADGQQIVRLFVGGRASLIRSEKLEISL